MILIYTHQPTSRVRYIFQHFFKSYTYHSVSFTDTLDTFIAHSGPKMSYTFQPLGNEFFIQAHPFLFQQGLEQIEIEIEYWEDCPAFFKCTEPSHLPFDIFAASFYMLSRYEEYLPHIKDKWGRFVGKQSLAGKNNFLEIPVVDIWMERFFSSFNSFFKEIEIKKSNFQFQTVMEVPEAYAYLCKSILRSAVELFLDFFRFRFSAIFDRFSVLFGFQKDPFEVFDEWIFLHRKLQLSTTLLFLMSNPSEMDRNISIFNTRFKQKIKSISDYVRVSLLASFQSIKNHAEILIEQQRLQQLTHKPTNDIRQHFGVIQFPDSFREFAAKGFQRDFSLHFYDCIGFRAGTITPFYFYDIGQEQKTPLELIPIGIYHKVLSAQFSIRKARRCLEANIALHKRLGIPFTLLVSNSFMDNRKPWNAMITKCIKSHAQ